ncbi:hypothetical protein TYRP_014363 [Tyrophagus putrescentiae]|nr:hypothetical protein TYRP_014363 [Tyrophagus putrescentiae]
MSLLIQTVIVYFLLVYFHHFGHCSATGTRPLFQLKGDIAKGKFCRQKSFDSVAFDGRNYRFSVTRRDIARDHITFELFLLNYNTTSDSFQYSSATFDNDNVISNLKNGMPCAFAYNPEKEKIMYIFSNQKTPIIINSLRTFSGQQESWFTKSIDNYKTNKFVGSFNWPNEDNSSTIFLLAQSQWKRTNLTLFELSSLDGKFVLKRVTSSWQEFFGCYHQRQGHSQRLMQSSEKAVGGGHNGVKSGHGTKNKNSSGKLFNVFTISILAFFALLIVFALLTVVHKAVHKMKLCAVKRLCQCSLFAPFAKTHFGVGGN